MGTLDHQNHSPSTGNDRLFESLKHAWLSSTARHTHSPPPREDITAPEIIVVSRPPPARVLP